MVRAVPGIVLVLLVGALTACTGGGAVGTSSVPSAGTAAASSAPSADPAPTASVTADAARYSIPSACPALIADTSFSGSFGAMPLNDPAVVGQPGEAYSVAAGSIVPTPAASGASQAEVLNAATQLRCIWRDPQADITNMTISLGAVDEATATAYLNTFPAGGYTCAAQESGQACTLSTTDPKYGVAVIDTVFLRDDLLIHISQANIEAPNLLATLVQKIWA